MCMLLSLQLHKLNYENPLQTRNPDLSPARRDGHLRRLRGKLQYYHHRLDGNVINLTTEELAAATDWCGVRSGRDYNKFKQMHLHTEPAQIVKAPLIAESPLSIECKVVEVKELGSHDMFIAEVVAVNAEEKLIDKGTGAFQLNHAKPLAYSHGKYYGLGEKIGGFGFSVKKKK